jgi:flagellar biosynthesis/type III secretory pathway protein FliH
MHDFLREHGGEMTNMLYTEWNLDDALRVCKEESIEEGIEKGIEKGIKEGIGIGKAEGVKEGKAEGKAEGIDATITAYRALGEGKSAEEAALLSGLPLEKVEKLLR